jgi:hypothetical protein
LTTLVFDDEVVWFENNAGTFSRSKPLFSFDSAVPTPYPGDFNGDGDIDIALVDRFDGGIEWYSSVVTTKTFQGADDFAGRIHSEYAVDVVNIDNDSNDELVFATEGTSSVAGEIAVFNVDAAFGTNESRFSNTSIEDARAIAAGDLDGDGDHDLIVNAEESSSGTAQLTWYPFEGGTFSGTENVYATLNFSSSAERVRILPSSSTSPAAVSTESSAGTISVYRLGNEGGEVEATITTTFDDVRGFSWADVDGLNGPDAVVMEQAENTVAWFQNSGTGSFSEAERLGTPSDLIEPESPVTLDVDEDGDQDVIAAGYQNGRIAWFEAQDLSALDYSAARYIADGTVDQPLDLLAVEVTGDDRTDLIATTNAGGRLLLFENEVGTSFTEKELTSGLDDLESVKYVNVDGDSDRDLLLVAEDGTGLHWLSREANGFSGLRTIRSGDFGFDLNLSFLEGDVGVEDFSGNSTPSIVTTSGQTGQIELFSGTGSGAFDSRVVLYDADIGNRGDPHAITIMDVDRDGRKDLVISFDGEVEPEVAWMRNQGGTSLAFGAPQTITTGDVVALTAELEAHDLDRDGDQDLVLTATFGLPRLVWIPNLGASVFDDPVSIGRSVGGARGLHVQNLVGDARPEIIVSGFFDDKVAIYPDVVRGSSIVAEETREIDADGVAEFSSTATQIAFASVGGRGDVTVRRYSNDPATPLEIPESNISQYRFTIDAEETLTFGENTEVRFDVSEMPGISVPGDVLVYARTVPGLSTFRPLETRVTSDGFLAVTTDRLSEFVLASDNASNPLPVELSRLTATLEGEHAVLTWQTTSETDNAGFEVERQARSGGWRKLGRVAGAGTTPEPQSYRFRDTALPYSADSLTYRLRQVDLDGTTTLSEEITLTRAAVTNLELLGTYPNPARTRATIRFAVPARADGTEATLQLYDLLGRRVRQVLTSGTAGRHEQQLDVSGLSSGLYVLRLVAGDEVRTQRITVVR